MREARRAPGERGGAGMDAACPARGQHRVPLSALLADGHAGPVRGGRRVGGRELLIRMSEQDSSQPDSLGATPE